MSGPDYKGFAIAVMESSGWPEGGELDPFELQEMAIEHGMLRPEKRTTFCADECPCMEYVDFEDFPFECYRREWL
jgi:hypothetical protein